MEEPLINLTPLIDVVFVVLITFMIIAPILDIDRVELADGAPSHGTEFRSKQPLTITVRADNTIWIAQRKFSLTDLELWLRAEKKKYPHAIPKLIHDRRAQFGTYQAIKNRIEACGFEEMDVVLQPQSAR